MEEKRIQAIPRNETWEALYERVEIPSTNISPFLDKLLRSGGVEVAEMCGVHNMYMRAQGVLGAVEVEVAIGSGGIAGEIGDEVTRKPVATPHAEFSAPVVGERLFVSACTRHGEHAGNTYQGCDDGFRETRLGEDEQLAVKALLLHLADGLAQPFCRYAPSRVGITPCQLVGTIASTVVAVTTPEEEDVGCSHISPSLCLWQDDRCFVRLPPKQDVADVVGREVGIVVVDDGAFQQIITTIFGADYARFRIL